MKRRFRPLPMHPREPVAEPRRATPELEAALGARIRAARVAARMSQTDVGQAVGTSYQQFQKYELGKDRVSASTLQGIATTLGVHPGSFFDGETSVPTGSVPDVRAAMGMLKRIQRIRNPVVVRRLMALIDLLAEADESEIEQPTSDEAS